MLRIFQFNDCVVWCCCSADLVECNGDGGGGVSPCFSSLCPISHPAGPVPPLCARQPTAFLPLALHNLFSLFLLLTWSALFQLQEKLSV